MIRKIYRKLYYSLFRKMTIFRLGLLSEIRINGHRPQKNQPLLTIGKGKILFEKDVKLGVYSSPFFLNGYCYLECRTVEASIHIDEDVWVNNNFSVICEKTSVYIGKKARIGIQVMIMDSDFHAIEPAMRDAGNHVAAGIYIEENVFIGNNVTILKGTRIGKNSVIANGSIVSGEIPPNTVAGGIPARVLKTIDPSA